MTDNARAIAKQAVQALRQEWYAALQPQIPSVLPAAQIIPEDYDRTNLHRVCEFGDLPALQELIAQKVDIHRLDDLALGLAADQGHVEIVRLLLEQGANVHAGNDIALRWATGKGRTEVVGLLLEYGANIHADDDAALRRAVSTEQPETVRFLLERGANVHAQDDFSILYAVKKRSFEILDILVAFGAPMELCPANERKAYDDHKAEQIAVCKKEMQGFARQTLGEIFNSKTWAGHVPDMLDQWQQIPAPLQDEINFSHILAESRALSLKQYKPKITLIK
jgi:ankyrin repeat protein